MKNIILFKEGGEECEILEADKIELGELQKMVGGWVEAHRVKINRKSYLIAIDEEGKLKRKNPTGLLVSNCCQDVLVGNVVIMKNNFRGMNPEEAEDVVEFAKNIGVLICGI